MIRRFGGDGGTGRPSAAFRSNDFPKAAAGVCVRARPADGGKLLDLGNWAFRRDEVEIVGLMSAGAERAPNARSARTGALGG